MNSTSKALIQEMRSTINHLLQFNHTQRGSQFWLNHLRENVDLIDVEPVLPGPNRPAPDARMTNNREFFNAALREEPPPLSHSDLHAAAQGAVTDLMALRDDVAAMYLNGRSVAPDAICRRLDSVINALIDFVRAPEEPCELCNGERTVALATNQHIRVSCPWCADPNASTFELVQD